MNKVLETPDRVLISMTHDEWRSVSEIIEFDDYTHVSHVGMVLEELRDAMARSEEGEAVGGTGE